MTNKRKKTNTLIIILIFLIILMFIAPQMGSFSKDIYNSVNNYYLASKGFYFNSDKLSIKHSEFEIENNWSGAETYSITINLNSKRNDLVFAESDIDYEISFTNSDNIVCTASKTKGTIKGSNSGGLNEDYFIITINPKDGVGLPDGTQTWVDIEVKSTAPYVQTLSGKLYVGVGSEDISYEIMDSKNNPYLEVNITNSLNEGKDVTLEFDPNIILLDMTDTFTLNASNKITQDINNYAYVNSVTSHVKSLETTAVRFYKVDPSQNYTFEEGDSGTPVVLLTY